MTWLQGTSVYNGITSTHKKNNPKNNNNKKLYRNTFTQRNKNENGNPYSKIVAQVKKFNLDGKLLIGRNLVSSYKPQEEPQFFLWSTTVEKTWKIGADSTCRLPHCRHLLHTSQPAVNQGDMKGRRHVNTRTWSIVGRFALEWSICLHQQAIPRDLDEYWLHCWPQQWQRTYPKHNVGKCPQPVLRLLVIAIGHDNLECRRWRTSASAFQQLPLALVEVGPWVWPMNSSQLPRRSCRTRRHSTIP